LLTTLTVVWVTMSELI